MGSKIAIHHPLVHLVQARIREFLRQPEAVFWSYFFPVLMVCVLGLAFNRRQEPPIVVDVLDGGQLARIQEVLAEEPRIRVQQVEAAASDIRLRTARTDLQIKPSADGRGYVYAYDSLRPESAAARAYIDDRLQRGAGRLDPIPISEEAVRDPGSRYVDFLVPGLLGMNIMAGGLWGVGFATVQMRIRKVLKRLLATPLRRRDFLISILISRLVFLLPGVLIIFGFSWLTFGVVVRGSFVDLLGVILVGSFTFSGIGLLVASRANSVEMVSGLMNLVMLPMWLFSGVFFSTDRFPEWIQPLIQALPLTPMIAAMRAITLEGASLFAPEQLWRMAILAGWAIVSFVVALRIFRWT